MERKRTMPACLWIAARQLKNVFARVDFWIVIVTLAAFFSVYFPDAQRSLATAGERVGVFAVFPIALQESDVTFLILIGYLFLTTDIPDFGPGTDMQAIRVTRGIWYTAQWVYMAVLTAAYYLLVGILELVFFIPSLQISGGWGAGVTGGAISGGSYPLAIARSFLEHGAWKECLAVFALVVLLSLVIGGACCVCNTLTTHAGVGVLVDALMVFAYLLYETGTLSLGLLSPTEAFARFAGTGMWEFLGYAAYYVIWCTVIYAIGYAKLFRVDIRAAE